MSQTAREYELVDFGRGRKLERFGSYLLDRPCPAAGGARYQPAETWMRAAARFERQPGGGGSWVSFAELPRSWPVEFALDTRMGYQTLLFRLQASPIGQVGVFAEQVTNWRWIADRVSRIRQQPKVLNLFAYTGGSTMIAAAAGAEVVHVDAARNMVQRARRNAERSLLAEKPIRWITEDAITFCRRELKRGNRYDAVILDPPSYGHGPKGEAWKIARDLPVLLELCGELTSREPLFLLVTCHTPGIGPAELAAYTSDSILGHCGEPLVAGELTLETAAGRKLPSGVFARWPT